MDGHNCVSYTLLFIENGADIGCLTILKESNDNRSKDMTVNISDVRNLLKNKNPIRLEFEIKTRTHLVLLIILSNI